MNGMTWLSFEMGTKAFVLMVLDVLIKTDQIEISFFLYKSNSKKKIGSKMLGDGFYNRNIICWRFVFQSNFFSMVFFLHTHFVGQLTSSVSIRCIQTKREREKKSQTKNKSRIYRAFQ